MGPKAFRGRPGGRPRRHLRAAPPGPTLVAAMGHVPWAIPWAVHEYSRTTEGWEPKKRGEMMMGICKINKICFKVSLISASIFVLERVTWIGTGPERAYESNRGSSIESHRDQK